MKLPLSQEQMGVVVACLTTPDSSQYNLAYALRLPLSLSADALCVALRCVMEVRQAMHLRFMLDEQGTPLQFVDMAMPIPIQQVSLSESELSSFLQGDFSSPFQLLSGEPLVRIAIVTTEQSRHLLISWSHAITDATTFLRHFLQRDLTLALASQPLPPDEDVIAPQPPHYTDEERAAYLQRYQGLTPTDIADYTTSRLAPLGQSSQFLPQSLVDDFCKEQGCTPNRLFSALFTLVLSRWSREENLFFTQMRHGRNDATSAFYGMFAQLTPTQVHLSAQATLHDLFDQLRAEAAFYHQHPHYPFNRFCHEVMTSAESLPVVFNFYGSALPLELTMEGTAYPIQVILPRSTPESLACTIYQHGGQYEVCITGSLSRYKETTLSAFAHSVTVATRFVVAHPNACIADVPLLDEADSRALLRLGEGKSLAINPSDTFLSLFAQQVCQTPDHLAVQAEDGAYTYSELAERSDVLASMIERGPTPFVAILLPRTRDFLLSVIAVEKAGCAYVPIDEESPQDRISYIIRDCGASTLITTHALYEERGLSQLEGVHPLFVDEAACPSLVGQVPEAVRPQDAAYMIYTSGSTGRPKGVVISHRAKAHLVQFIASEWHLTGQSRILCHSSFAFDASVEDLFPVLTVGGAVYIVPSSARRDLHALHQYICANHLTGGCLTTQLGQMLLQQYPDLPMDYLVVGGERMSENPPCSLRLINTYGPTEFTVDATYYELSHSRSYQNIPIGRPLCNQTALVCDAYGHLLPRGAVGELCLTGSQIADGYWQRDALTAEKFCSIPSPLKALLPDAVYPLYHTGDLVRWNEEGVLEFIGRTDHQVKLRGYRIELGEVETILQQHTKVAAAVVMLFEKKHLAAYVQRKSPVRADELRDWLRLRLPSYMVPTRWASITSIPLTLNGKVDTRSLPAPLPITVISNDGAPQNVTETMLTFILQQIMLEELGHDELGIDTDILELGLTSLDLMRFSIEALSTTAISLSDIYSLRTIRRLANEKHIPSTHWITPDDPAKPLLLFHAGIGPIHPMQDNLLSAFTDEFSIFGYECVMDPFFSHDCDSLTLADITDWLMREMPDFDSKRPVLMTGYCVGAELAMVMAMEYARRYPDRPRPYVINYDGEYCRTTPYDKHAYDAYPLSEAMLHKLLLTDKISSLMPTMKYDGPIVHVQTTLPPEIAPPVIDPLQHVWDDAYVQEKLAGWRSAYPEDTIIYVREQHVHFHQNGAKHKQIRQLIRQKLGI